MRIKGNPTNVKYCKVCGAETRINNSRCEKYLWRGRKCVECGANIITVELDIDEYNAMVDTIAQFMDAYELMKFIKGD